MSNSAWSHWSAGTAAGHADELAILLEHVEDVSMAEAAMIGPLPGVVAYSNGQLITATRDGVVFGDGPCEVVADVSATMRQGSAHARYVPIPFALAVEVFIRDWSSEA